VLTERDMDTVALARRHCAPIALHASLGNRSGAPIRNLSAMDTGALSVLVARYRAEGYRVHLTLDSCG
jgi:hypothetical protein